ncbi:hypothetical protein PSRA_0551 [Pseudoscardovia radai]|uniref:Uncharacterized protein n=1 Tax=Pseudoscardovia radai TaxID=987066 RepID=A0A261EZS1_9BIFI|nr:hypothetical protein PSRA_0551 [Pseudoscardovia radai]
MSRSMGMSMIDAVDLSAKGGQRMHMCMRGSMMMAPQAL